jgi:dihydropyrimidinase
MHDLVIKNGTLVTPGAVKQTDIAIDEQKIAAIGTSLSGRQEIDAAGRIVFPGVIDAHTHMALPVGGTRSSDDFFTGTRAATCGGVTTIVDFTVGSRDTAIPGDIEHHKQEARDAVIDYALHAEVIGWIPGSVDEFREAIALGVGTFKFYTAYAASGRASDNGTLYHAFRALAPLDVAAFVHCEDEAIIESMLAQMDDDERTGMMALARSRPPVCEGSAIEQVAYFAGETGVRSHIVHVSSGLGLAAVKRAKARGVRLTAETCPQYLLLTRDVYEREDARLFSASPALREHADQEELWSGLRDGTLDLVATDHCPFTRAQKVWKGSFLDLPYGLPGVETLLPLLYSEGVAMGRLDLSDLPRLLSENPAKINGIYPKKGSLAVGSDADIVILDPMKEWTIRADDLHMSTDFSPYEGRKVRGRVAATIARGKVVYSGGVFCGEGGWGEFVPSSR